MILIGRPLRQHFRPYTAVGRLLEGEEGVRAFKNPSASDVIYGNPEAKQNRLQLFHLLRLKNQAKLDMEELQSKKVSRCPNPLEMRMNWTPNRIENPLTVSFTIKGNLPGIEAQFTPESGAVSLTVHLRHLGLSAEQRDLLIRLVGDSQYNVDTDEVNFTVSHFPFRQMNERLAMEILHDLMAFCKVLRQY